MGQRFQHYQTSFSVAGFKEPITVVFKGMQSIIRKWMIHKERQRSEALGSSFSTTIDGRSFYFRTPGNSTRGSSYKTDSWIGDDSRAWVVLYSHVDHELPGRYWITEVGLRAYESDPRIVISILISYEYSTKYLLAKDSVPPMPSIPGFVRMIFHMMRGCRYYSGKIDITQKGETPFRIVQTDEDAESVLSVIRSPARIIPVILLVGESALVIDEARRLGKEMYGKTMVFVVPYKFPLIQKFYGFKVGFNQCRILLPFSRFGTKYADHILFDVNGSEEQAKVHSRVVRAQLANYSVLEGGAVCSFGDVHTLIRKTQLAKLGAEIRDKIAATEYESVREDLNSWMSLASEASQEIEVLQGKMTRLEDDNYALLAEVDELKTQLYNRDAQVKMLSQRSEKGCALVLPSDPPDSMQHLIQWLPFFGNLDVTDDAKLAALDYRKFSSFGILWKILSALNDVLFDLKFSRSQGGLDLGSEFRSRTGFDYASGEGTMTKKDSALARLRKFSWRGKDYEMWAHVKYGNQDGKQIRVHFAFDEERKKIVVGYIGSHLDNATTRTIH